MIQRYMTQAMELLIARFVNKLNPFIEWCKNNKLDINWSKTFQSWQKACSYQAEQYDSKVDNTKSNWYNTFDTNNLINYYRKLFDKMYEGDKYRTIGFKEISFPINDDEFAAYIEFLKQLCGRLDVKFVFTIRNIDTIIHSGWWSGEDRDYLLSMEHVLRDYAIAHPKDVFVIRYEHITNVERIKQLFLFLDDLFIERRYGQIISKRL